MKVDAVLDRFPSERHADRIAAILATWSGSLLRSPQETSSIGRICAPDFAGASLKPSHSRVVRSNASLQVRRNTFSETASLNREAFLRDWSAAFTAFSKIETAEFQITAIDTPGGEAEPRPRFLNARVRYEIVGAGPGFHCEQRVGTWYVEWASSPSGDFLLRNWRTLDETQARSTSPIYADIARTAFAHNTSYTAQMLHGSDYWRTVLDGACGIDIYGHNGVSVADVDNDGFDDVYVCQPAGLPNRLYRNLGDGMLEDITERSGLGILENTACALFADFNNTGKQDVILVRSTGPLLFLNEGGGKFRLSPDAFQFAIPPQGTFTGASVADYDRDGWLDIYFCLYSYYQGTGQYRYPSPYHDAENGPPNFLMRNHRDGTFRDVTANSGMDRNNTRYSFCCQWNDYDNNGWPDLYVVNDFGRKNLYRNNGDGTFTDVAAETRGEDVGAGMSIAALDYDNDGREDLYVANMWTAAGVRVSMQQNFKTASSAAVRALYQKHAMGNSLLRNGKDKFEDTTLRAEVGVGRWAWSSDTLDFDHDGYPDLYITNGMVSGPSRSDLNSFFWRQVVANSPDDAGAAHDYEQGWNAINELIRSDGTWSGHERNVFYANNGDGTFSDVSAAVGLDFIEDGRSFALADFDHDGRLEIFLKNRSAPQLRALKNVVDVLPPSISFRLQGTKSNRDAIGAVVTVETENGRQTRSVQAGSGFLSQHSKDVFFGLGDTKNTVRASIRWPSGLVQQLKDLPSNHRIWVVEGSPPHKLEPFQIPALQRPSRTDASRPEESLSLQIETWLLSPLYAPDFSLPDFAGNVRSLAANRGKPTLLNFWTTRSAESLADLQTFDRHYRSWAARGLQLIAINVDEVSLSGPKQTVEHSDVTTFVSNRRLSFPILRASEDAAAVYNILYRQVFDRHRDISLPTSFLIDENGEIVKVYQGPLVAEHVEQDFRSIPRSDADRLAKGLPFAVTNQTFVFGRNYLSSGSVFYQRGYLEQAEVYFQRALKDDPSSAEALYGIGSVYLNQNKNAEARAAFERCVKLQAGYPDTLTDAWNNLGVLATREGRVADSIGYFEQALKLSPRHLLSLDNLGKAYRVQKRWDDARTVLQKALENAPDDPEANYSLAMVYAQTNDTKQAEDYLQRALGARPDYPEALNNLGILYLLTQRRDAAVASFEQCIRVAPTFDQAYLNLARIYALEGSREKARGTLAELLKQHPDHQSAKQMLQQLQP